jgi:hypothetical protein
MACGCSALRRPGDFCAHRLQRILHRGREKARFDQQPVEACATISACLEAYRLTHEERWLRKLIVFRWFLGKNDLQAPLYDATTGGCRDGLHPDRVNENQGAESTLSFLMALLEMQRAKVSHAEETAPGNEHLPLNPIIHPPDLPEDLLLQNSRKPEPCTDLPLLTRYSDNPILSGTIGPMP